MFAKSLFILVLLVGVVGFFVLKLHPSLLGKKINNPLQSVKGASTFMSPQVQSTLGVLQQEIFHLSPSDISTSSPQVQAILKTLQKLPQAELQNVCQKLCVNTGK